MSIFNRIHYLWLEMRTSFWFVPAMIVLCAMGLASLLITIDVTLEEDFIKQWPLVFGAGADGSRGLLSTVAGSMITVAGVVFSITIVALTLTSSQYTSRVLRNFMGDSVNQTVLGVFVGIFAYCLVVLRTIRGGDEGAFVPSLAVLGGLLLALLGIACLIYFIHYISMSIQASSIIATAAHETISAVDHLFPEGLGEDADDDPHAVEIDGNSGRSWRVVPSSSTGYIQSLDGETLLHWAKKHDTVVRMERGIGEFVIDGTPLVSLSGSQSLSDDTIRALNNMYVVNRQRTVHQNAAFGIRQIVDIALRALSPGVNDTTTAVMCVDHLTAVLVRLAPRKIATARRLEDGELRVIARGPSFQTLLADSFDQIRQNADGNVAILVRMIEALETVAKQTTSAHRRQMLRHHANLVADVAHRTIPQPHDREAIDTALTRLTAGL
jgi:uncharacterized membrane protein